MLRLVHIYTSKYQKHWFFANKVLQNIFSETSLFSDRYFNHYHHCYHYHYQDYHHCHHQNHYYYFHCYHSHQYYYHDNDYHQYHHHYQDYHYQHCYH